MKLNKLVYDVREALRQEIDDSTIDDRYIIYLYGIKRAKYLRNDANNFQRTIDNSVLQTLCLEVEQVNTDQCLSNIDCEVIMRTVKPIPKPLEGHIRSFITSVKPSNRIAIPFNFVNKERALYSKYSPFNKSIYAFLDDDLHIYLVSESNAIKLLECLTITGIFEDPLELKNYKNCCNCSDAVICYDEMNSDYPLQPHHIDSIRLEILQDLVRTLQIPQDKENNSDDN